MAAKPVLRKGLTRDDLLQGTWINDARRGVNYNPGPIDKAAMDACLPVLDGLLALVEEGQSIGRKDVREFFSMVETFSHIRDTICRRLGEGDLSAGVLDRLVKDI